MKNNLIQFPGTTGGSPDEEDDFCGAAGFMFEGGERQKMQTVYALEADAMSRIKLMMDESDSAGIEYHGPEALTEEFKTLLLEVLHRRQRENVRTGRILTVSHPLMERDEQIPFLAERSEVPTITVRRSIQEDIEAMNALRDVFPVLMDVSNALRSNMIDKKLPGFFV